jgi:CHASE3 domain sensor protein
LASTPSGQRSSLILVAGIAAFSAAVAVKTSFENKIADEARREIQTKDFEAGNDALTARGNLRRCLDSGGLYDFDTGQCRR